MPGISPNSALTDLRRRCRRGAFRATVLTAAALAACISHDLGSGDTAPEELSIGYVAGGNLDELRGTLAAEALVYTGADGEYEPGLAEDWSVSGDGLTVTLTLVSGVTFHDGAPLTADIVKEFLDSARVDPRRLQNDPTLADIDAVDAVGPDVVRLHYTRDTYLRLEGLSIRVERQVDGKPVGTGPFVLQEQTRDAMTLVANPAYRRAHPPSMSCRSRHIPPPEALGGR